MSTVTAVAPRYYSAKDVSVILGISRQTVIRHCLAGEFDAFKMGDKWLIPIDQFEEYIEKHTIRHS